jgi:ribosome-associated translation inhibitor RaiA
MRLHLRSQNLPISQELRGSVERRLRFVLGRFGSRISRVTVHLAELIGPDGVTGKRCRILVHLLNSGRFSVEDTDSDLAAVVNRAMDRVSQSVRRELERQNEEEERRRGKEGRGADPVEVLSVKGE